jgi:predicted short-subunit dehydrogenase-like oxidoreductase (DUF2520 family)
MAQRIVKGNVADQAAFAVACLGLQTVDANINHHCAGFQPIAGYHLRAANRGNHDICAAHNIWQILRSAMRDSNSAIFGQQQLRHRLTDNVRPPDDHGILARQIAHMIL